MIVPITERRYVLVAAEEFAQLQADVANQLDSELARGQANVLDEAMQRNLRYFDAETKKLDRWAEDLKETLKREIKELETAISVAKKEAQLIADLKGKVEAQEKIKEMERSRNDKRKSLFAAQDKVEDEKDELIAAVEARLEQRVAMESIFTIRWRVV